MLLKSVHFKKKKKKKQEQKQKQKQKTKKKKKKKGRKEAAKKVDFILLKLVRGQEGGVTKGLEQDLKS